jgi:hypothetical protein
MSNLNNVLLPAIASNSSFHLCSYYLIFVCHQSSAAFVAVLTQSMSNMLEAEVVNVWSAELYLRKRDRSNNSISAQ